MIASTRPGLWSRLRAYFRPEPIASAESLQEFLRARASLIAQKCAIDYVRGKTGLASYALFTERTFQDALDICHYEGFAAVLGDLLLVAEGHLRAHVPPGRHARLREVLLGMYGAELTALPLPAHRPGGWGDLIGSFGARLQAAAAAQPRRAGEIADHSAQRLFDTLPIHAKMRELDEEVVYGAVRFRMIAVSQEMQRRLAPAAVLDTLAVQNETL